jgi:AcrR family transcriptional regulator
MPKIIEDIKENILIETRRQIQEYGYSKVTVRSIASSLNVGVGTIYNYYSSKDMIVAAFMVEDWMKCLGEIKQLISNEDDHLKVIYDKLGQFIKEHEMLFNDTLAEKNYAVTSNKWHSVLRGQIADIILLECDESVVDDKEFLSLYIAESLISWCLAGKNYSELSPIFNVLLKK